MACLRRILLGLTLKVKKDWHTNTLKYNIKIHNILVKMTFPYIYAKDAKENVKANLQTQIHTNTLLRTQTFKPNFMLLLFEIIHC